MISRYLIMMIALVALSACGKQELPSPFHASNISHAFTQADFHLTDHKGQPRSLGEFKGKVVAVFFGYTHCPDVCPTTLADLAQAMQILGKDAEKVQVIFITVDPERDTPQMLAQYAPAFNPTFLSLYGDAQTTAQVAKSFYVSYEKHATASSYTVDHSVGTFLIDPQGHVRLRAPLAQSSAWLAEDIRLLLAGV